MSNYTQSTDFSAKDALTTGDPEKIILGADIDAEFSLISTAISSKMDDSSGTLTSLDTGDSAIVYDTSAAATKRISFLNLRNQLASVSSSDSTSGTSVAFTGLTTLDTGSLTVNIKRIQVVFAQVSTNGTDNWIIQIGSSGGGYETTGYRSESGIIADSTNPLLNSLTSGFHMRVNSAAAVVSGIVTLVNIKPTAAALPSGEEWVASGILHNDAAGTIIPVAGFKSMSTATPQNKLTQLRVTTAGGTDTFDAGVIHIIVEY